jgi:hypothetical protein
MCELMHPHILLACLMGESSQERRLGENHHPAQMVQADHAKNILIGPAMALVRVVERIRVDQHFT